MNSNNKTKQILDEGFAEIIKRFPPNSDDLIMTDILLQVNIGSGLFTILDDDDDELYSAVIEEWIADNYDLTIGNNDNADFKHDSNNPYGDKNGANGGITSTKGDSVNQNSGLTQRDSEIVQRNSDIAQTNSGATPRDSEGTLRDDDVTRGQSEIASRESDSPPKNNKLAQEYSDPTQKDSDIYTSIDNEEYHYIAQTLREYIRNNSKELENLSLLKPYSFILVDDDKESVEELYLVDDALIVVDSKSLMQDVDKELDDFLARLMRD